ncbi:26S proteasome non-ATPase regulatory subunit 9 isoform X1 [Bactrocera neohumeralis]|uniref:26S proteasome non-ATPase regulatory subunit 9 isoform X1 n=1 Tax=Bactrocera tryoni TaxID=59916 RepID=UPI001A967E1B|nr:26S proteasome non-ATPase regulatory subunit 9 isoform X1 [Bactrocera tryoni]XP_050320894.1 26S proteasome non-ATPase regulatory subunit 9 isoform X1 [Bactrocera neohumeralis]
MVVPVPNPTKDLILKLMAEKEAMESKISDYGNILVNNANVGMDGPLVDAEGFPRNDIDVYQVRQARQQIICLQNDYKSLMKEIEKQMHKLHSEAAESQTQLLSTNTATLRLEDDNEVPNTSMSSASVEPPKKVIVKINMISPGSPAEEAGLRVDDEILEFGTINSRNFQNNLTQIGDLVRHMQNKRVPLNVLRMGQHLDMILIPKSWSGRGLLGCNIILADP